MQSAGRHIAALCVAACVIALSMPAALAQQPSTWIYDVFVQECRKSGGTPGSTREQYLRGERFKCNTGSSGQAGLPPDGATTKECKINIDWVFEDRGARARYESERRAGKSAFEAVVGAQAHNAPVQRLLRQCQTWAESYLGSQQGTQPGGVTLGNRRLGQEDCRCIDVVPTGESNFQGQPGYRVSNKCDGMNVSVRFDGTISRMGGDLGLTTTAQAGLMGPGQQRVVRSAAGWTITSIKAVGLNNAAGSYSCNY